jgi:hypothetical protein
VRSWRAELNHRFHRLHGFFGLVNWRMTSLGECTVRGTPRCRKQVAVRGAEFSNQRFFTPR